MEQAIRSRLDGVKARPDDGERWGRYGMTLDAHGFDVEAEAAYGRAAALDPRQFRWPYYQAALIEAGSLEGAVEVYRRAIELDGDYAPAHLRLAQVLERLDREEEAIESYRRARRIDPQDPFAPLGLGSIALRSGELESAIAHLEEAYRLDGRMHATVSALANAYHLAGDTERARRLAAETRGLPRITYQRDELRSEIKEAAVDRRSHVRRAVTYRDVGQLDRALREARAARARAPDDVQTVLLVGELEYRSGDFAQAETSMREALRLAPHRDDVRELLARVLYERGSLQEATALARGVLERDGAQANMHVLLGRAAGQQGDDRAAIHHLERALEVRPDEKEWRFALAGLLIANGRAQEGQSHLRHLLTLDPAHSAAWNELGHSLLERGELAAAEEAFERALESSRDPTVTASANEGLERLRRTAAR